MPPSLPKGDVNIWGRQSKLPVHEGARISEGSVGSGRILRREPTPSRARRWDCTMMVPGRTLRCVSGLGTVAPLLAPEQITRDNPGRSSPEFDLQGCERCRSLTRK